MSVEVQAAVMAERRIRSARRRLPRLTEWRWLLGGRRRSVRRASEDSISRLDRYSAPLFAATILILVLSTLDAGFTVYLLEHGLATEANPLMAGLLSANVQLFSYSKTALTGCGLILLVLYSEERFLGRLKTAYSVYAIAGLYTLLVGYELALFANS